MTRSTAAPRTFFGRISGTNAAEPKTDNYQGSVLSNEGFQPTVEEVAYETGEGQHVGRGKGKGQAPW